MAIEKATLPLPVGGWNTSAGRENQPEGTTRGTKNARNRDWRAGGALRLARRAGMTKFVDEQPCGDNPFQALASITVVENTGTSSLGSSFATDTFVRADTSTGQLGSFDGTAGSDYNVSGNNVAVSTSIDTNSSVAIDNFEWNGVYAAGDAAKVASNKCVDNQSADTSSGTAQASMCYFLPNGLTEPTDNYALRLTFTTDSGFTSTEGVIGFFCFGDAPTIAGGTRDAAFWVVLSINSFGVAAVNQGYNSASGSLSDGALSVASTASTTPNTSKPALINSGLVRSSLVSSDTAVDLQTNTQYLLEMRVSGRRVELLLNGLSWIIWPDVSVGSNGTAVTGFTASQNDYGFTFYNVGSGSRAPIVSIDKFEVLNINVAPPSSSTRVVTVVGGDVCHGDEDGFSTATNGSAVVGEDASVFAFAGLGPTAASNRSYIYLLKGTAWTDGDNYKKVLVSGSSATVQAWSASPGSLPSGSSDSSQKARFGSIWRNRVVLYGLTTNPDNWYMSASGDADDWDYTATPNGREAIAGDNSGTGLAPGGITCMAGFDDDNLIMGLVDSLIVMRGDPALGGALDGITDRVGIVGPRATALSDQGVFYFVDRTGLYAIEPGTSQPQRLTHEKIDEFFEDVDWDTTDAVLFYSRRFDGLRVWLVPRTVPTDSTQTIKSLWWDGSNTPWYDEFPAFLYPRAVCGYQTGNENIMLVGGTDGYLRRFTPDSADDDGNKIDSYVDLSPIVADGETEIGLNEMILKPGSTCERFTVQMRSAMGADGLDSAAFRHLVRVNGPAAALRAMSIPPRIDRRIRGGAVGVRIGDSEKYWSIEQARALLDTGYALAGGH